MSAVTSIPATPQTNAQQGKTQQESDYSGFLALLAISSVQAAQTEDLGPQQQAIPLPDARPQPRPAQPAAEPAAQDSQPRPALPQQATPAQPERSAQPERKAEAPQQPQATRPTDHPDSAKQEKPQPEQAEKPAAAATRTDTDTTLDDVAEKQKKIREALGDKLDSLDMLLTAIIQALSLSTPASGEETAQPQLADAAAQIALPVATQPATAQELLALIASAPQLDPASVSPDTAGLNLTQTGAGTPIPGLTPATAQDAADAATLLKDLQSLLQNLQRSLQSVDQSQAGKQQAQAADALATAQQPAVTPAAPLAQLQQQLAALVQELAPQGAAPVVITAAQEVSVEAIAQPQAEAPPAPAPLSQLFTAVKEAIGGLRDQLKALQQENEQSFAPVRSALQAQFEKAQEMFRPAAPETPTPEKQPQDTTQDILAATVAAATAAPEQAEAKPPTISIAPAPVVTTAASPLSVPTLPTTADLGRNTSGQQQQGQQGQPNAQALAATGAAETRGPAPSGATPDFSRSLQRATPQLLGEQVAFQVKTAVNTGTSKIRIQLDPADLGKIDIKLTVEAGGKTGVNILVDSRHTLELLQRDAQGLARALADAGLSADGSSLNFNLRGEGQQQGENAFASSHYRKAQPDEETIEPLLAAAPQAQNVNLADGLDITI